MVLPVKISIDRATCLVHTVDITHTGGETGGFPNRTATGNDRKSAARGPEGEVSNRMDSADCPERITGRRRVFGATDNFWGVDLSDREHEAAKDMQALMTLLSGGQKPVRKRG